MKLLYAARYCRFDLLRPTCALAQNVTKWDTHCDAMLHRLISYVSCSLDMELVGWVGDDMKDVLPHLYADGDLAGCLKTGRSTAGIFQSIRGPNTCFPISAMSKRHGNISISTPESELTSGNMALRLVGLPSLDLWDVILFTCVPGRTQRTSPVRMVFHEDNTAFIQVCRSGRNQTMRHLNRHHRISVGFLHEVFQRSDWELLYTPSEEMCADIFTKAFSDPTKWRAARMLVNIASKTELNELLVPCHGGDRAPTTGKVSTAAPAKSAIDDIMIFFSELPEQDPVQEELEWDASADNSPSMFPSLPVAATMIVDRDIRARGACGENPSEMLGNNGAGTQDILDPEFMAHHGPEDNPAANSIGMSVNRNAVRKKERQQTSADCVFSGDWLEVLAMRRDRHAFGYVVGCSCGFTAEPASSLAEESAAIQRHLECQEDTERHRPSIWRSRSCAPAQRSGGMRPVMATEFDKALEVLRRSNIPLSSSRQNVLPAGHKSVRSCLLGAFSQGSRRGVTSVTKKLPELTRVLTQLAKDFFPKFQYNAITVNSGYSARPHTDRRNVGPSMILALGDFRGGRLWIRSSDGLSPMVVKESLTGHPAGTYNGDYHNIRHKLLQFNGKELHAAEDYEGERFSIIWFQTPGISSFEGSQRQELKTLGFNVDGDDLKPAVMDEDLIYEGILGITDMPVMDRDFNTSKIVDRPVLVKNENAAEGRVKIRGPGLNDAYSAEDVSVTHPDLMTPNSAEIPVDKAAAAVVTETTGRKHTRCLVEICAHHDSVLGVHAPGDCEVIRITEEDDILTDGGYYKALTIINEACRRYGGSNVLVWVSTPCTGGTSRHAANVAKYAMAGNIDALVRLHRKRETGIQILRAVVRLLRDTEAASPGIAWEWPLACAYWQLPEIKELTAQFSLASYRMDGCMLGVKSINTKDFGAPMRKSWRIRTNRPSIGEALTIRCCGGHEHALVEGGKNTRQTERYTEAFAQRVHRAFSSCHHSH